MPYGNQPWFRNLLGWIFPVNYQLLKKITPQSLTDLFLTKNHVLQDFVVPLQRLGQTLQFTHDLVHVYPIWLCPAVYWSKPGRGKPFTAPAEMYIDVGIYGNTPKTDTYDHVQTTKQMEKFVIANKGFQGTYADVYMTREEFLQMFELMNDYYSTIRKKYGAEDAFPDVYDKISYQARRGHLDLNKNPVQIPTNGHEKEKKVE
jgi:delta24-sterol reductase